MIDIIFPSAMRAYDGIGDHSRILAAQLAHRGHEVRLLGAGEASQELPGVEYINAWPGGNLRSMTELRRLLSSESPRVIALQWEQFSYGRRGFNPQISRLFNWMARECPDSRRLLIAHEAFTQPGRPGKTAMWFYQRNQAIRLARSSDAVIHSSARGNRLLGRFNSNSAVIPVFPNVPSSPTGSLARSDLGIAETALVVLLFGHVDARRYGLLRDGLRAASEARPEVTFLYVGKDAQAARTLAGSANVRVVILERADPERVGEAMRLADVALSPFPDGVSLRRGSFAALMSNCVPTVTNVGADTDSSLVTLAATGAYHLASNAGQDFAAGVRVVASSPALRSHMRNALAKLRPTDQNLELLLTLFDLHALSLGVRRA